MAGCAACIVGNESAYRKSWFEAVGYNKFPETWDAYRDLGKTLKAKGQPIGQGLGHSFGDPPSFWYPLLWAYGGMEEVREPGKSRSQQQRNHRVGSNSVSPSGRIVATQGGLAWDDSSNNRAFLAGTISSTQNGASIILVAKREPGIPG